MNRIRQIIRSEHTLSPALREAIVAEYGDRGRKALRALDESRVKRYLDFFIVVGYSDEYVVEEDFCTCSDFAYRGGECWHILAVKIAEQLGIYERYDLWYQDSLRPC